VEACAEGGQGFARLALAGPAERLRPLSLANSGRWTFAGVWRVILEVLTEAEGSPDRVEMINRPIAATAAERGRGFRGGRGRDAGAGSASRAYSPAGTGPVRVAAGREPAGASVGGASGRGAAVSSRVFHRGTRVR